MKLGIVTPIHRNLGAQRPSSIYITSTSDLFLSSNYVITFSEHRHRVSLGPFNSEALVGCTKTNFGVYTNGYKSMYEIQKFFLMKGPLFNIFEGPGWRSPPSHPGQSAPDHK